MDWAEITLFSGLFVSLAGVALMFRAVQRAREPARDWTARYVEGIGYLGSQAILFGGLAVMTFGNVVEHVSDETALRFSLLGATAILLAFGIALGRLLMRWQMQRLLAELDTKSGEFTPHS